MEKNETNEETKEKANEESNNNNNDNSPVILELDEFADCDLVFKIIVIGNCGVGKTCITNQAVKHKFSQIYQSTIGVEYFTLFIKYKTKIIKFQIWDTCGQEIYRSLISSFYKNSSMAIIVYAIDDEESFKDIDYWMKEIKTMSSPDIKVMLIGNKIDLDEKRKIKFEKGEKLAKFYGINQFFETSAKTGENIQKMFMQAGMLLYDDYLQYSQIQEYLEKDQNNNNIVLSKKKKNSLKKCCS